VCVESVAYLYIINNTGIVCNVKRVSLWGLYREKGARCFRRKKKEMSDISMNNGQVGLLLDSIYNAHV